MLAGKIGYFRETAPPPTGHPEALAWRTRVIANGGTVSASTLAAVSDFCAAIDAAGIRSKFRRMNPFAGSNLSACLVPLYRGESSTGTQYGGTTDANPGAGPFVSGDYTETGANGGLLGNSTSKHLNTGFRTQDLPGVNDCHIAVWSREAPVTTTRRPIGCIRGSLEVYLIERRLGGNQARLGGGSNFNAVGDDFTAQSMIASRTSSTSAVLYKNGTSIATQTTTLTGVVSSTQAIGVFAALQNGTTPQGFFPHRLCGYSIGGGFTAAQAASFHNAWAALQAALIRDRTSSDPAFASVTNADAKLWIDNVYANGGTVSTTTANAVNDFCNAIDAAGIRDRFYRLNLFAGTGLAAALVPLYRGQSLGGTQFGNATDTNSNFVSGNYAETGSSGGLGLGLGAGTNTNRRLDTGLAGSTLSAGDRHVSAYEIVNAPTDYSPSVLSGNATATMHGIGPWTSTTQYRYRTHNTVGGNPVVNYVLPGHWLGSDFSSVTSALYRNGQSVAGTFGNQPAGGSGNTNYSIFGITAGEWSEAKLGGYSIGLSMTAAQVATFYTVMQNFQTALQRNV